MVDRVHVLLAQASIIDALQTHDIVEVLTEVLPHSDHYIPVLQFLIRPDNLASLLFCVLEEPPKDSTAPFSRGNGDSPTYEEYAIVYRADWILCSSNFSAQLIAALVALQGTSREAICQRILQCNARDTMNVEALVRFCNVFMDQYSPESLLSFFGSQHQCAFVETLLVLIFYEPVRDVLLRIFNEIPETTTTLHGLTGQLLYQLALLPTSACATLVSDSVHTRTAKDQPHHKFSRMIFSCDLLTDLIHEHRRGSIGHFFVTELLTREEYVNLLLDEVLADLQALPTSLANESYLVKVLNSLLQQYQCGCVSKIVFYEPSALSSSSASAEEGNCHLQTLGSPHEDLPLLWKKFTARLPTFLQLLALPPRRHFKTTHIQMVYLMLPILNVSCSVVDRHLIAANTMQLLLDLIMRFSEANILHCAISRLYIVALEDSPFMFGKELPAFRTANDPLRLHLLLGGCLQFIITVYKRGKPRPPPAFLDIAISFDQAMVNAQAHSPHLFPQDVTDPWQEFRTTVLVPTQLLWEEQYEATTTTVGSPNKGDILDHRQPGCASSANCNDADYVGALQRAIAVATGTAIASAPPNEPIASLPKLPLAVDDVPTPLAALYNEEERNLMLKVASTGQPVST